MKRKEEVVENLPEQLAETPPRFVVLVVAGERTASLAVASLAAASLAGHTGSLP